MNISDTADKPIFLQVANGIADAILCGAFAEETQVPSITEFSLAYTINPATALKGINLLVDDGILYKKRGVGMFVSAGAQEKLLSQRKEAFYECYVQPMAAEAARLELSREELAGMVDKGVEEQKSITAEQNPHTKEPT